MDIIDAPVRDAEMDEIWDDDEPSDEDDAGTQVTGMTGATGGAGGRRPMMFQTITRIQGTTPANNSITLFVRGFRPYFQVKVPDDEVPDVYMDYLRSALFDSANFPRGLSGALKKSKAAQRETRFTRDRSQRLFYFDNNKEQEFIRLTFTSLRAFRQAKAILLDGNDLSRTLIQRRRKKVTTEIYEANLDPLLRFIHEAGIQPCSWCRVENLTEYHVGQAVRTQIEGHCHIRQLGPLDSEDMPKILIVGWDIECDSSHGDMPQATKSFSRPARELIHWIRRSIRLVTPAEFLAEFATALQGEKTEHFSAMQAKQGGFQWKAGDKLQRAAIGLIRDIKTTPNINPAIVRRELEILVDEHQDPDSWEDFTPLRGDDRRDLDVEYDYLEGDPVIQIGGCFRFGEDHSLNIILCLRETEAVKGDGVYTISFETEEELLLAWTELIRLQDPDILTGWNIDGFDNKYIADRARELGISDRVMDFSRINDPGYGDVSRLKEVRLSSSALGDNIGNTITMRGRILMDMLSVFRRMFANLDSQKLDNVAATFINGKISPPQRFADADLFLLPTSDKSGLSIGNYVNLIDATGEKQSGKVQVMDLTDEGIVVRSVDEDISEPFENPIQGGKPEVVHQVKWALGKDDVGPQEIFRYFKTDAHHRGIVAKQCLMDCELVLNLDERIKNQTTSRAMGNVCLTPLTFIWTRGQGVKLQSLVFNECRKRGQRIQNLPNQSAARTIKERLRDWDRPQFVIAEQEREFKQMDFEKRDIERMNNHREKVNALGAYHTRMRQLRDEQRVLQNSLENAEESHNAENPLMQASAADGVHSKWKAPASLNLRNRELRNLQEALNFLTDEQDDEMDGQEGAVVLEPKRGLQLEDPVAVVDQSSLYPSSMISENISTDSLVYAKEQDLEGNLIGMKGSDDQDNLEDWEYVDIEHDIMLPDPKDKRKHPVKVKAGVRRCRFAQHKDPKVKSTIPEILKMLLKARKDTRKKQKTEKNPFLWGLLEAQQLAYKVTANSLYGQLGARTSKIRFIEIAASTTAFGRKLLLQAKETIERLYGGGSRPDCDAEYVYGDTDSVFINFRPKDPETGERLTGKEALKKTIELGMDAEKQCTMCLKEPHTLEYEKTFWPFALFNKKKQVGNKYETDVEKQKQTNMGIVLKRRDNAPCVKDAYQIVVDTVMNKRDVSQCKNELQRYLSALIMGNVPMKKLTITKRLAAHYKNPDGIAHAVLAERIGKRDPGNKPQPNDRIRYVYFRNPNGEIPKKQGDRVETPEFMKEADLRPDYEFYIRNQIQRPVSQFLDLILENIPGTGITREGWEERRVSQISKGKTEEQAADRIEAERFKEISRVIFDPIVNRQLRMKTRKGPLDAMFKSKTKIVRRSQVRAVAAGESKNEVAE